MYCFVNDFLNEEQVQSIISAGDNGEFKQGRVDKDSNGLAVDKSIRSVSLCNLKFEDKVEWLGEHIQELSENVKFLFQSQYEIPLDVSGGIEKEGINYLVYYNSDHYAYHRDLDANSSKESIRKRTLSLSVQLSDEKDYDGGELVLKIGDNEIVSPKQKGSAIVFLSDIPHKINAVTSGTRKAFVTWMHSKQDD